MMRVADLIECFCSFVEKADVSTFKNIVEECMIHQNKNLVVFGTDGEFHYLNAPEFAEEKKKVYYYAKQYDGDAFDEVYGITLDEGYWVYQYSSLVNFYEFRWFKDQTEARAFFDEAEFSEDDLLLEKAIFYIAKGTNKCLVYEKG